MRVYADWIKLSVRLIRLTLNEIVMVYDAVIIGGGMSALLCGIKLIKSGQSVAIVSTGQSALHFNAGALSLFNHENGKDVLFPLEAMERLSSEHPYFRIGVETIRRLAPEVKLIFGEAGITLNGCEEKNHYRLTPIGLFKPVWLSMKDYAVTDDMKNIAWGKVAIVNIRGYVDFYPEFVAAGLQMRGLKSEIRYISSPELDNLRKSSSEMRATDIARVITSSTIDKLSADLNQIIDEVNAETVIMPAVIGLYDEQPLDELQQKVKCDVKYVSTMPMSLGGMRAQMRLRHYFKRLGGTYLLGDTVVGGKIENDIVENVTTVNLGEMPLEGKNFVLSTGSFFSHGIEAQANAIIEPIFRLDVNASDSREDWYCENLYDNQAYMKYGVITDPEFYVYKNGRRISNLRAIGAVLGGYDALKEGSGGGVASLTALRVAEYIIDENRNSHGKEK